MLQKRHSGRATAKTSIRDEIAHLRGLDLTGLRSRWQSVFQRPPPDHLPRHLMFAIIAYRIQADRLGDLDHETGQVLDRTDAKDTGAKMSARLVSFDQKRIELTPGTVLVREWDRRTQRVMVMADGFAWTIPAKIPTEAAYRESAPGFAVSWDWMVVCAVPCEPVSTEYFPVIREFNREVRDF